MEAAPPAEPPAAESAQAPEEAAAPEAAEAAPLSEDAEGTEQGQNTLGHRDASEAFVKGEPIEEQEVPVEYEGEAVAAPDESTNQFEVTVYEPLAKKGRRNRGIASTWNKYDEVLFPSLKTEIACAGSFARTHRAAIGHCFFCLDVARRDEASVP